MTTTVPSADAPTWTRRIATVLMSLVAALALSLGLASPAAASTAWANPSAVETQLACASGSIVIAPFVSVQNGDQNGQFIAYRYYITGSTGQKVTSGWSVARLVPFATTSLGQTTLYGTTMLAQSKLTVARSAIWEVQVQVAYWNGGSYAYSGWYKPLSINGQSWQTICRT